SWRSAASGRCAYVAQSVEHFLGKEEVSGSNPDVGSNPVPNRQVQALLAVLAGYEPTARQQGAGWIGLRMVKPRKSGKRMPGFDAASRRARASACSGPSATAPGPAAARSTR